jgi:hypothetical protein
MRTKADQLHLAILFALRGLKIQGRKGVLTETDKEAIATHVVSKLRENGDQWQLDEELPRIFLGHSTPAY